MSKLKVSELFYSIQGEGRYMGVPSVFLRVFGCNFTCDGFGMPRGEKSNERKSVASSIKQFKNYKDLPLVHSGCDSYASWDPKFKDFSPLLTTDSIVESIQKMLPQGNWADEHLVITGGEPLLGWQKVYPDLLDKEPMQWLPELTFETNGTQKLTKPFKKYLSEWTSKQSRNKNSLTFSVSAKLPNSGEEWSKAINPDIVNEYQEVGYVYLKFVISSNEDLEDAKKAVSQFRSGGFTGPVYIMPIGGVESVYSLNNRRVAEFAMDLGWRYSDRLQVPLFKNEWGT